MAQQKGIRLGTMRLWVPSLASLSGLRIWRCCELWCRSHRHGLDLVLLSLWCRLAATAIRPLAWGPPYSLGVAQKKKA